MISTSTDVNQFVRLHFKHHYYRKSTSLMLMLLGSKNLG